MYTQLVNHKTYSIIIKNNKEENWPKRYRSEFIEPGVISYEDIGAGMVFVSSSALDKMANTFIGKPVINEVHQDMTAEEAYKLSNDDLEAKADGIVYAVGKTSDGWHFCDMIIWDSETKKNIEENGYSVSCAYVPTEVEGEGECHGVPYDEEVINGVYTHNAIVKNPRYERAKIYELPLQNCKELYTLKGVDMNNKQSVFKHFFNSVKKTTQKTPQKTKQNVKSKQNSEDPKNPEEEMMNMEGAFIKIGDEEIPLEEAVEAYKKSKEVSENSELSPEDVVDVDGEEVSVAQLIEAFSKSRENEDQNEEEENEESTEEEKENECGEEPKENSKDKKKYFSVLKNASSATKPVKKYVNSKTERFERGKNRYGSVKKEI